MPTIDAAVLALAKRGDAQAHAALYTAFSPLVFTLARRMLASRVLAEDVLQETFVEVIRKIATYRGDADFGYWIRRIAINRCLMQLRSAWSARRVDTEHFDDEAAAATANPDVSIALERALDALSPSARAVVWLHDVEGYGHAEIGVLLNIAEGTSKAHLFRARRLLRARLDQ